MPIFPKQLMDGHLYEECHEMFIKHCVSNDKDRHFFEQAFYECENDNVIGNYMPENIRQWALDQIPYSRANIIGTKYMLILAKAMGFRLKLRKFYRLLRKKKEDEMKFILNEKYEKEKREKRRRMIMKHRKKANEQRFSNMKVA